jgi:murein tripeptide amidase MpaA
MKIETQFDGSSIQIVDETPDGHVELAIPPDNAAEFRQWFMFSAIGANDAPHTFALINAGECTYPDAFENYSVVASYDRRRWFRVPTTFDGQTLEFLHRPRANEVTYAYFAPYPLDRHARLLKRAARVPWGKVDVIGKTAQDRDVSVITLGEPDDRKLNLWVIARQHPGETMAEWYAEGLVDRLLDEDDEVVKKILSRAVFHIVPNMNPDGSFLGNLRTNGVGFNLNRAWLEPNREESPEVLAVRDRMHKTGVDFFLDIHGDERNPYCFLAGCEGNPGYSERLRFLENMFEQSLCDASPDFQDEYGYDRDEPGGGDLRCAGNYVGETFDCLAFTLEMPFKDNANEPDEVSGWSPERSIHLGATTLESVEDCLDHLR